jgi:cyclophilin family peptidyl-prolyl cis-trans isomerase
VACTARLSSLTRLTPLALLAVCLAACGGGSKDAATTSTQGTTTDVNACTSVTPPRGQVRHETKPTKPLDGSKTYDVKIQTNCGSFTIRLATKTSPATTASFVSLTRKGFFDGTVFHRIVPGFVIQGGDPTGTGQGGPGYQTVDRPPASTRYTLGVVAMAKTQTEAPGTAGSQFFVVTAQDAQLPPDYAVLGKIVAGNDTVSRVGQLGDPSTEQPTETVEIEHATVASH